MPQRHQRPYPPEFRREAVSLVKASGRSIREVTGELRPELELTATERRPVSAGR